MKALRWSSVLCALTALGLGLVCSEAKPKKTAEPAPAQPKPTLQPTQPTSLWRTWSDAQGNRVEAELLSLDGEHVQVRTKQGQTYRLNLTKLVPEDRVFAEKAAKLLPGPQVPAETAAAKVDALVRAGLQKAGGAPNPALAEEQFVRRLYLDVTGRIPTAKEVYDYLRDTTPNKRARLIDTLLTSEGYASQMFNWLADMLRVADHYGKQVRSYVYQEWLKEQIAANRHWDTLVYEMLTAEGRISSSGPTGYLLRDRGMPLDNLSNTLTTFLGANVACAQCHDHPTASWTERNFYEMAAFFGATEQGFGKKQGLPKGLNTKFDKKQVLALLTPYQARVETLDKVTTTFPKDYKYDDAKPGSPVQPKLITWEKGDEQSPAYLGATPAEPSQLRERFATWMTHPDNPRFALTIANRLWKKLFGLGVQEPITDLDDLQQASNRELLLHLGEEMKRVHFDLREFQRILLNTSAYQAQASPSPDSDKGPYLFPGPLLRRMSGEQVWDSILSLVVGPELDQFKLKRADQIRRLDIPQATLTPAVIEAKLAELHQSGGKFRKKTGGEVGTGDFEGAAPPQFEGLTLARASELPQPSKESHFLRNFGQSDRQIADSNSTEGGVPQLLMMMNGPVQKAITSPASLVLRETSRVSPKEDQIRYLYLSFLGRFPSAPELLATKSMISNGLTIKDLTWVFLNTREFLFIQ
jgi:hypothetical protein